VKWILRATALAVVILLGLWFYAPILTALGSFLVKAAPPQKADIIVVLAGDGFGHRILKAGELVKEGWAPVALVDGPNGNYGRFECDLAIPFAVEAGYPESYFLHGEFNGHSTAEEARFVAEKLQSMGVKRVLVVTSNYHTRRAGKIFHRAMPGLTVLMVAAPDENFKPNGWWRNREARKTFVLEWEKTISEW
jgi:uncharacterized SAM-binding protein YcdF (DUF218 family)